MRPLGDPNKKSRSAYNLGEKAKAFDFLQDDLVNIEDPTVPNTENAEKARKDRERSRREQYKQVRAHVKKDDGRLQAYGWSLPARLQPVVVRDQTNKSHVPVPVPVYCRPLTVSDSGLKIWCAAAVNLSGGRTPDGGSIVGASVFYSGAEVDTVAPPKDDVDKLDQELKEHEKNVSETGGMSSLLWICTSMAACSKISVIDANNPGDIIDSFKVTTSHILSIASVPGAMESDYPTVVEDLKTDGEVLAKSPNKSTNKKSAVDESSDIPNVTDVLSDTVDGVHNKDNNSGHNDMPERDAQDIAPTILSAIGSPPSSGATTPTSTSERRLLHEPSDIIRDGISDVPLCSSLLQEEVEKLSSVLPTMWLGCQSGSVYVHSAVKQWKRCLHSIKLRDAVLSIVHVKGRILIGLSNGNIAVFHRAHDGQWDLRNYHIVELGSPAQSIRCMTIVANKHVWCGYKNVIHVIDPKSISIMKTFDAHPRRESQVRQMAWVGDGVWVSIRLDSTLRLYHAYTHNHLQDVDIEPYVSKMLGTGKLGFSFVRITSMLISCKRLWIGTGNGVIISVPLSENKQQITASVSSRPGGIIRVYSDHRNDSVTPGSFIPYCSMSQAQLSFHGHRDAVKFFVSLPGRKTSGLSAACDTPSTTPIHEAIPADPSNTRLVISGGEGYIDFRIGDGDDDDICPAVDIPEDLEKKDMTPKSDRSHLIVWQITSEA